MRYRIRHTTKYGYSEPVALSHNLARLAPRENERQQVHSYQLVVSPDADDVTERRDVFNNRVEYFSIQEPHRGLSLTSFSEVEVAETPPPAESLAWDAAEVDTERLLLTHDSPLVPRDEPFRAYAEASFAPGRPLVEAALELTERIHTDFDYDPRATDVATPIHEAFEQRAGVCQDFAHVQLACLRSLGLAARYVSGYLRTIPAPGKTRLVGADASHAWVGVHCGPLGWIDFDPTNNCVPSGDHVTVAVGRDYGDVCPIQGVFVGGGAHTMNVSVDVAPIR